MARGRQPIAGVPQKDLPPKKRNSRAFSFRACKTSDDANEVLVRQICDDWMEDGIFTEMMYKAVLLAEGAEPMTNQELSQDLLLLGQDLRAIAEEQAQRLAEMEAYISDLHKLIRTLSNGERVIVEQATEDDPQAFPDGFLDRMMEIFDDD